MSISSELREIEEKQDELLRRRKEILRNLHKVEEDASRDGVKLEGLKRRNSRPAVDGSDPSHVNEADFQTRKKHRNNYGGESSNNKKLSSAISVPEDVSKKAAGKGNETEFKTEKPEFRASVPDLKKRNSNLFRNMLGHLDRAKVTLEKQKSQIEKQEHAVHEAESKNQEESSRLKEDYVKNLESKRKQLLEDKMILERSIVEKEKLRLLKKTELYFTDISNYILTKMPREKPQLFWKPARTKDVVNKLTEETKNVINGKKEKAIHLLEEQMKASLEALNNADNEKLEPLDDKEENEHEEKKESDRKNRDRDDDRSEDSGDSDIEKEINAE